MRPTFFQELHQYMKENENIFAITGDLGFVGFDRIRDDFPQRFINCGAAEQSMLDIAVGLALSGKTPFVYSITPFLIYRPFETIRNYIDHEKIGVVLVGSGRDTDYSHDGFSHHVTDLKPRLDTLTNIRQFWPSDKSEIHDIIREAVKQPSFISLKR